jgi:hypothetical protein
VGFHPARKRSFPSARERDVHITQLRDLRYHHAIVGLIGSCTCSIAVQRGTIGPLPARLAVGLSLQRSSDMGNKTMSIVKSFRLSAIIIAVLCIAGCDDRSSSSAQSPPGANLPTSAPAGMNQHPYLAADGGPHMLLPAEAANAWAGASSMLAATNPKSDYGRACAATANAQLGAIAIGSTSALVFADPPMSAYGTSADGLVEVYYLQSWTGMNLDALIAKATAALPTASLTTSGTVLQLHEPDAFLLFAGDTVSSTAYGVHRVKIPAGKYNVLVGTYTAKGESVTVYRLQPAAN